jgi:hypothetical protein
MLQPGGRAAIALKREQARFYNAERLRLCQKYGVASLQEMDRLVRRERWISSPSDRGFDAVSAHSERRSTRAVAL